MRDLKHNINVKNALDIQQIKTNTTTTGEIIDVAGYESVTFCFQTGTVTDGDYTVTLYEDSDSAMATESLVDDADLIGTEALASYSADADDNKVRTLGYIGDERYLRLKIVSTNTSSGAYVGAVVILGHPHVAPTDQDAAS